MERGEERGLVRKGRKTTRDPTDRQEKREEERRKEEQNQ